MAVGTPLSIQKQEKKLAKQIDSVYRQAAREIRKKLKDFNDAHKAKNAKMKQMVQDGTLSKEDYKKWLRGQVFQSEQWKRKLDDVVKVYRDADIKAHKIIGGESRNVFVEAANHTAFDIEQDLQGAIAFNLYDGKTVEKLLKDNPKMLPEWKIDEPKDYVWNEKRVQNAVAQGIIQGESIDEIGERLTGELATSNANKMVLFARTAVTGAQNAGRMERLHETEDMGVYVKKKWLATLDNRTRDAHVDLDGEEADIDEPFHNEFGDIMYPGDPTADPANVYNCRCTLTYVYPKYQHLQQNHERYDQEDRKVIGYKTYKEWKAEKQQASGSTTQAQTPVSIPRPKQTTKQSQPAVSNQPVYKTTKDWVDACKNNPDIPEMLKIEEKTFKKYTEDQIDALYTYTGSFYERMNGYLRLKAAGLSEAEIDKKVDVLGLRGSIKLCQEALSQSKLDRDMVLRRGTDLGDIAGLFMKGDFEKNVQLLNTKTVKELNDMFQGSVGSYAGFTSTSSQWNKGYGANPVEVLINAPKGTEAASIMKISRYKTGEGETLLQAGTRVICDKIEEIPDDKDSDWDLHPAHGVRLFLTIITN